MNRLCLWAVVGVGATALIWSSGLGAQPSAAVQMISETDCTSARLGSSIPASSIGSWWAP